MTKKTKHLSAIAFRELLDRRDWSALDWNAYRLSDAQKAKVLKALSEFLPIKRYGHGYQTYNDLVRPEDAEGREQYQASELAHRILRYDNVRTDHLPSNVNPPQGRHNPFSEPVRQAIGYLERCGVNYQGWHDTYLYWEPVEKHWVQVDRETIEPFLRERAARDADLQTWICGTLEEREAILAELDAREAKGQIDFKIEFLCLELEADRGRLWTTAQPISRHFRFDRFVEFSPLWHALNILYWSSVYRGFALEDSSIPKRRHRRVMELERAAEAGIEVGRSWSALDFKPLESHARRGEKVLAGLKAAGGQTAAQHGAIRERRLEFLKQVIHKIGPEAAFREAAIKELGTYDAVKKTWQRHNKKWDT